MAQAEFDAVVAMALQRFERIRRGEEPAREPHYDNRAGHFSVEFETAEEEIADRSAEADAAEPGSEGPEEVEAG